jgi:uncharacterized protein (TIGR02099 family)
MALQPSVSVHSTMKRVGRAVEFLAWTLFFVLAAGVLAVRFWLLPDVERYREQIVAAVSFTIGQPVRIGGIEAGWLGLNPRIQLRDVRIYDSAGREALTLPSIHNRIAWSSLLRGELKIDALAIDGLRLQVRRDAQGELYVAGMKLSGDPRFGRWLAAQDEIVLRDAEIEWHDELRGAPPLALAEVHLRVRNSAGQQALGLSARAPEALGSSVELRALLDGGSLSDPGTWSGRLYAELGYTDLAAWRAWVDFPWQIDQGQGALRAWLTLESGQVRSATADLALSGVSARLARELAPLRLSSLQGRVQVALDDGRYQLAARNFALGIDGRPAAAPSEFNLSWSSGPDARGVLDAAALELQPLGQLAASLPLPERVRKLLSEARPRGRLAELRVEWRGELQAPDGFTAARAKFIELAAAPVGALPGLAGLSGSFDATADSARVVLATRKGEVVLPQVFPQPRIPLDFLNGLVEWERRGDLGFALRLASVTFSNEHFSGNVHGTYASSTRGPGTMDLAAQLNRADATQLARYLPHARLMGGDATREWLVRSVLAGHSGDVRVRIRGDLAEFPFRDPARGQFSVAARLERGVLDYAQGWPRIENIEGELVFERNRMQLAGRGGSILGVALANVDVAIKRLGEPDPHLEVNGEAEGATADFLRFIEATPVRRMSGGFTDALSASGRGRLRLKLDLPLADPGRTQVAGEYELAGNDVVVHAGLPAIEGATGRVGFTESTVTVNAVEGRLFGGRVALNGATQADGSTRLVAKGEATVAGIHALFDHPWRRHFSGQAAYTATIHVAKGRAQVLLHSPLQGISSTLPAPLAKSAAEALPLQVELAADERLKLRLGRILAADLVRRREGGALVVQRAGVALSPPTEAPLRLPEGAGVLVYGSLAALDLDKWLPLFGDAGAAAQARFDVRIGRLDAYGKRWSEVSMRGAAQAGGWSAALASQELAGDLSYRASAGGKLVARLTRFRTPDDYPGAPERSLQPKDLPTMDLVCERFTWRGKELGRVEILGQRVDDEWRIEKLAMANADARLAASGAWRSGAPTRSHLDFELATTDAGQFLARVGYPGLVKGGKAQFTGSLAWNGDPGSIDYPSLSGGVRLEARNGQFLEIEPGFGKLVSLMSLQSLPRRIALDFRDVFSKGFGFEVLSSSGQVEAGVMAVKDFRMSGSSAQVEMTGDVDLARETQNMRVRVIPSLGDSAATVIALVNPLLAIPAAIAQKILKDPLGHIFAFDYAVTGGWSDPKVAKLGVQAREVGVPDGNP